MVSSKERNHRAVRRAKRRLTVVITVGLSARLQCFRLLEHVFHHVLGRILSGMTKRIAQFFQADEIVLLRHLLESELQH